MLSLFTLGDIPAQAGQAKGFSAGVVERAATAEHPADAAALWRVAKLDVVVSLVFDRPLHGGGQTLSIIGMNEIKKGLFRFGKLPRLQSENTFEFRRPLHAICLVQPAGPGAQAAAFHRHAHPFTAFK